MKNRTGLVVLVDMLALLFFVVAFRSMSNEPRFLITRNNSFGDPEYLMIAQRSVDSPTGWEVRRNGNDRWDPVHSNEEWLADTVGSECSPICRDYGVSDLSQGRILIGGYLGRQVANFFYNNCRASPHACRNVVLHIDQNQLTIETRH